MTPTCATCRYWVISVEDVWAPPEDDLGRCHYRLPETPNGDFPIVGDDDWCGEHAPREGG